MALRGTPYENHISGIADWHLGDNTGYEIVNRIATASGLDTGGAAVAAKTHTAPATGQYDWAKFTENTLYLNISALAPGAGAWDGATTSSIVVNLYARETSTVGWSQIMFNTGLITGNHAMKLVGTGGNCSGISHLPKVKLEIVNSSNSGTAVMVGYIVNRK